MGVSDAPIRLQPALDLHALHKPTEQVMRGETSSRATDLTQHIERCAQRRAGDTCNTTQRQRHEPQELPSAKKEKQ